MRQVRSDGAPLTAALLDPTDLFATNRMGALQGLMLLVIDYFPRSAVIWRLHSARSLSG